MSPIVTAGVSVSGAGDRTSANNHILRQQGKHRETPQGSEKNKPEGVPHVVNQAVKRGKVAVNIPAGEDVVQWLIEFCRHHQVCLTMSRGSGQLSDIVLLGQQRPIEGPFPIRALSGTVTQNYSLESRFPLKVTLPVGWDCELYGQIVGGKAANVQVEAKMTVFKNIPAVESVVGNNNPAAKKNPKVAPSVKCHRCVTVTPPHLKNNERDEQHNLMNLNKTTVVMNKTTSSSSSELNKNVEIEHLSNLASSSSLHNQKKGKEGKLKMMMESENDDDDFWNSLSPVVDLFPFNGV